VSKNLELLQQDKKLNASYGAPGNCAEAGTKEGAKSSHLWPWFALQARSRHENIVATQLQGKGYDPFLPLYKVRRRWSDRIKEIELPLFAGYLFCRFDPADRLPILVTPGIVQIVGIGKNPAPIDEREIANIRTAVQSDLPKLAWPFQQVGQKVRVECGPLRGLEGLLLSIKGRHRLILSVTLLQRSVAVEVDESWVSPIPCSLPVTSVHATAGTCSRAFDS
jgi:transcription antitermination factor NusG